MSIELHPDLPRTTVDEELVVCGIWTSGKPCWARPQPFEYEPCSSCALILKLAAARRENATLREAWEIARPRLTDSAIPGLTDDEERSYRQAVATLDAALAASPATEEPQP